MKYVLILIFLIVTYFPAYAAMEDGEITATPICSKIINRSGQTILGTISTQKQVVESGDAVSHRQNFRLAAKEEKPICTTGPFFQARRIQITLKTLIPLFSCKTNLDGDIYLDATPSQDFTKLTATCR